MVSSAHETVDQIACASTSHVRHCGRPFDGEGHEKFRRKVNGLLYFRKLLRSAGIQKKSRDIICSAWRRNTKRSYLTYFKRWGEFCEKEGVNALDPNVNMFIKFLTLLYEEGLSYSSINTARSAVSSLSWTKEKTLGNHVLITKLMKGIFNLRPSIPKTKVTWDTGMVLQFLKKWHPAKNLSLRQLSIKTTLLCLLVSGQRGQTIWLMDLRNLDI